MISSKERVSLFSQHEILRYSKQSVRKIHPEWGNELLHEKNYVFVKRIKERIQFLLDPVDSYLKLGF
jgi:hypothetical protein